MHCVEPRNINSLSRPRTFPFLEAPILLGIYFPTTCVEHVQNAFMTDRLNVKTSDIYTGSGNFPAQLAISFLSSSISWTSPLETLALKSFSLLAFLGRPD